MAESIYHRAMQFRLSALMFLQYAALGLWCVTLPTFLRASPHEGGLNLSSQQTGWLYATFALAAAIAPLIAGLLADTLFATQKVLAVLHLAGAVLLLLIFRTCTVHQADLELTFQKLAFVEPAGSEELWHTLWEREALHEYLRSPETYRQPRMSYPPAMEKALAWIGLSRIPFGDVSFPGKWQSVDEANARLSEIDAAIAPALERVRAHPQLVAEAASAFRPLF